MEAISFTAQQAKALMPTDGRMEQMGNATFSAFEKNTMSVEKGMKGVLEPFERGIDTMPEGLSDADKLKFMLEDVSVRSAETFRIAADAAHHISMFSMVMKSNRNFGQHINTFLRGS